MKRNTGLSIATAAGSGLIFGLGLAIAQMTDPQKVKSFLDVAAIADGNWDGSLALVMGAGFVVMIGFYALARRRVGPVVTAAFVWPTRDPVDSRLVLGASIFGVGWGLSGLCPGPAIALLGLAPGEVMLFVVAMLLGSWGTNLLLTMRNQGGRLIGSNVPAA